MTHKIFVFFLVFVLWSPALTASEKDKDIVYDLLKRVTNKTELPISLSLKKENNETYYEYKVKNGVLELKASNKVALCRGFYDYIKNNECGLFSWSGNNIVFPPKIKDSSLHKKVVSPFKHHYYFNVVTFGYSMPYWDWERWEKEIDWMALHGVDMPLALVGYEAILARVWKRMGLTDEEINSYFVGPAHLPWMRMGNISGIDGPLNPDWHTRQITLQHKILKRMKSLDMKPICPGFPGFIPKAFQRIYPNLNIVETHWGGAFHNWMISPEEPLFAEITKKFIQEWEKEFGKNDYYLVDSFNEMDIPFPEKGNPKRYEMAANYGQKVYESIKAANSNAVWVMQGWMFGYQRNIWDYETLGALVSKVPDDKMLLLDLAVDYNKHFWKSQVNWDFYKGFYNKLWVYSVIPNMGGKVGMTGILEFYANGHLEVLNSTNKGNLVAHGMAPEGIENNEVIYELLTDAGWSSSHIDIDDWLKKYSVNRYGKVTDSLQLAWKYLLKSCYGTFTDHPRFNWQRRPGLAVNGTININDDYFKGLETFILSADDFKNSSLFKADLAEMTAHYLGGKAEILTQMIDQEFLLGDTLQAKFLQSRFNTLMLGMDALLSQHPILCLNRWLDFAKKSASSDKQRKQYLTNARRIITIWGPPVDDYSARIWSGLIRNYYLKRWMQYYNARNDGRSFDLAEWESNWVENNTDKEVDYGSLDVFSFSKTMLALSKDISKENLRLQQSNSLGFWSVEGKQTKTFSFDIKADDLKQMKGFSLEILKGKSRMKVVSYKLIADGQVVSEIYRPVETIDNKVLIPFKVANNATANNGCILEITLCVENKLAGQVCLLK